MNPADDAIWKEIQGFLSGDKDRRSTTAILVQYYLHLDDMKDVELSTEVLQQCFTISMDAVQKEDDPDIKTDLLETLAHIVSSLGIRNMEVDLSPLVEELRSYNDEQLRPAIAAVLHRQHGLSSHHLVLLNPRISRGKRVCRRG